MDCQPGPINDQGRYTITLNEADRLKFKVPSLRNVERTFPYMHDGRFATLEQVIDHYRTGVKDSPTLDPALKINGQLGIALIGYGKEAGDCLPENPDRRYVYQQPGIQRQLIWQGTNACALAGAAEY